MSDYPASFNNGPYILSLIASKSLLKNKDQNPKEILDFAFSGCLSKHQTWKKHFDTIEAVLAYFAEQKYSTDDWIIQECDWHGYHFRYAHNPPAKAPRPHQRDIKG